MDISIRTKMAEPNSMSNEVNVWLKFIQDFLPYATVFGLVWKAFDLVFKYFSEKRDAELRKIVKEEVTPDITKLTKAIDELREVIWEMKKHD